MQNRTLITIQGPLKSVGKNGSGQWVQYNCKENILSILKKFGSLANCDFLIVLWASDIDNEYITALQMLGAEVMILTPPLASRSNRFVKPNMKYNMYYAIDQALIYANTKNYKFFLKIRSDQFYGYEAVVSELQKVAPGKIFTLAIDNEVPDSFLDFCFGGRVIFMRDFFERLLKLPEVHRSVHFDMFYKLSDDNQKWNLVKTSKFFIFERERRYKMRQIMRDHIVTLTHFNMEDLIWRGSPWLNSGRYSSKSCSTDAILSEVKVEFSGDFLPFYDYLMLPVRLTRGVFKHVLRR